VEQKAVARRDRRKQGAFRLGRLHADVHRVVVDEEAKDGRRRRVALFGFDHRQAVDDAGSSPVRLVEPPVDHDVAGHPPRNDAGRAECGHRELEHAAPYCGACPGSLRSQTADQPSRTLTR
jgi:hypothetical protein